MSSTTVISGTDPRIKILCAFFFIFLVVGGNLNVMRFSAFFLILLVVALVSRTSLFFLFKRSLVIIPFAVLVAMFLPFFGGGETVSVAGVALSIEGLERFSNIVMKAFLSVFCMAILAEITEFSELLKGFEELKVPAIIVVLVSFTYRYFSVIVEEARRMKIARDMRSRKGNFIWQARTLGTIVAQLFIRSYERSERIYQAMTIRGFTGEIKTLRQREVIRRDFVQGVAFCIIVMAIRVVV
ncbi:MAG: cobalt ECF transporter T component CbiQ [Theionarchaea archaeon]|nr:cobalt ECF transporter T component CbiQ [Theionarchaea archaeon]